MSLMAIGVDTARFYLYVDGKKLKVTTELTLAGAVEILKAGKYSSERSVLMCSSSLDFAEEEGAPADFNGREVVGLAVRQIEGEEFVDSCPER